MVPLETQFCKIDGRFPYALIRKNSSSLRIVTPRSSALFSLLPAFYSTDEKLVFFVTELPGFGTKVPESSVDFISW